MDAAGLNPTAGAPLTPAAPSRAWKHCGTHSLAGSVWVRWLFLRWLGFVFFSAFLALVFQIEGLIGPNGLLPAGTFLDAVRANFTGPHRLLLAPTLLWFGGGSSAMHVVAWGGLAASVLLFLNFQPRWTTAVCCVGFLSFLAAAQAFASYQSDGMLMSAGLIALFLAPRPTLRWKWTPGPSDCGPNWWSLFALRWLWFSIYFGSGVAKIASGDPAWRHLTAMDHYYENGPLPTWLGWYVQQRLPHAFHAATAAAVLVIELGVAWLALGPRRARITCFWISTPLQIAIILTANYGFLNYIVLGLGFALLDDRHLRWLLRRPPALAPPAGPPPRWPGYIAGAVVAAWVLITGVALAHRVSDAVPQPTTLLDTLQPFRVADGFGLFAVMTTARFEIEFQGSRDGQTWTPYPFRFKPQDPAQAPGIYAPYQPRFDWNLWFASLDSYPGNPFVLNTEVRLLQGDPAVLSLFAGNPFAGSPPLLVRAVRYQYWFSTPAQKRTEHAWWQRRLLGLYAPELEMTPNGPQAVGMPSPFGIGG